ncbi:dTDP-4-dehydrorhamnose reductase [Nonomuraea coxensis DSM 45129]|uniref:dTDP-4-dehydrorhamnose reductase n=1 Tax=Nonomuraea coxensis DSM 45129 TaxID=1122611 RepID=A0ABX8U412_9ACTN|nr:sugar nucleotide-binding protein [Nonomuraea coxensis]QYC42323.1 dTDP-4-dehydrorhamnose reductase [Nonomuraea coxensis DSM 45129]
MRVTVIGGGGFPGGELVRQAAAAGHQVAATCFSRPGEGARLVHVSSDAVFSGRAVTYAEDAEPDPISPYGAAKAAAEVAVRAIHPAAAVVRTSLIIGDGGSPQEALVHALATGRAAGVLFTDDVRCPVHVRDLAAALLELAASTLAGVHHVAGADAVSRHELGRLIARRDGLDPARLPAGLRAGSTEPDRRRAQPVTSAFTTRVSSPAAPLTRSDTSHVPLIRNSSPSATKRPGAVARAGSSDVA